MLTLIREFNANLKVLNVRKDGKVMTAQENAGKSRLEAIWGDVQHSYHTTETKNIEDAIVQFAEGEHSDMLVMVSHQHKFLEKIFGSHLTRDVTSKTNTPLLILQDKG